MLPSRASSRALLSLVAAAVVALGCGLIPEQTPSAPTPVALAPILIPVIGGTPAPTLGSAPTPAPAPAPTPTPEAVPTPPPAASACNLPPSNPSAAACASESSDFLGQVDQAITRVTERHPELFNFKDNICGNCYFVKDAERFTEEVVMELGQRGLCAAGGEEVGVKATNAYNEQFDILISSGHIRRGAGSYRLTCRPAVF